MSSFEIIDKGIVSNPVISIAMLTYNHGQYIAQAIEGVLMQKISVPYELVIVDDHSTDDTRRIITEYREKHPDKIKLILQNKNIGAGPNSVTMLTNLSGIYVAQLEGDDYWTDPHKLQKQFDFLEKHPDFSSCFHNVNVLKEGKLQKDDMLEVNEVTTILDLAKDNYIRTCSYMFRNNLIKNRPDNFHEVHAGDYFNFLLIAKHGKIKKFREIMGVYRKHEGGIWSSNNSVARFKSLLKDLELLFPYFDDNVRNNLKGMHAEIMFQLASFIITKKIQDDSKDYLHKSMGVNMDAFLRKITNMVHENNLLKEKQKSLKSNLKNVLNIIKRRLTK